MRNTPPAGDCAGSKVQPHPIQVNNQWQLAFRWEGSRGEAEDIYLDDDSYR